MRSGLLLKMARLSPAPAVVLACLMAGTLGGCNDSVGSLTADSGSSSTPHGSGNPGAASVAFASIDGLPASIEPHFLQLAVAQAGSHSITVADPSIADYQIRGYLSAYPVADGTALAFVWDVFDRQKQRSQRIEDSVTVASSAADSWSVIDEKALDSAASVTARDLADYLSTTPQAIAAASPPAPARTAALPTAQAVARTAPPAAAPDALGYAALR